ncbi:MAG: hypothetical protein ACM3UR_16060 [Bacteroidota bacterium]|jgi:hypothetical protein|nr:hypothetical protein [Ignavibacteria bacterium]MCU7499007.1 hypothetical protein [Ignavibacteria bacterium]MCU7512419.1 hypothetical protein [Ignavibacteria bacterium]MCU7518610.1 hypothetical protein [Ignavibacteria bacterium]MCU7524294.1 hypothetical protein [Ignavibacteria bacterium]
MDKYLKAIRQNICSICADSNDLGKCSLTQDEVCALEAYLPQIVEIVHSIDSSDIQDYVNVLRREVCSECRTQEENGYCYLREDVNCSLDRYFPLIVETIQKADR